MERTKLFDLIALVVIAAVGLFIAYVTFGILQSQAKAEVQTYSVSGAIAGALISISMLGSIYAQFRRSSNELQELQSRNEELQHKLIRGAPRPLGFETEVDERHRIVLARPGKWQPRGGRIFDFVLPDEFMEKDDILPARFWVSIVPITQATQDRSALYKQYRESVDTINIVESHTSEIVYIGGEQDRTESLKIILTEYAKVRLKSDPLTKKVGRAWRTIPREEFESLGREKKGAPDQSSASSAFGKENSSTASVPEEKDTALKIGHMQVLCHNEELKYIYIFDFVDDERDFPKSSAPFNTVLDSARFLD